MQQEPIVLWVDDLYPIYLKLLLTGGTIMSVCKDHTGSYWIGTDNDGIYRIDPDGKQQAHFEQRPGISHSVSSTIMSICEDSDRNLWIGSYRDGLAKLNPQTGHCEYIYLPDKDHKPAQSIYSIIEDKHRQLWVGAMGAGLYLRT